MKHRCSNENCKKRKLCFDCDCGKKFCLDCLPWFAHSCEFNFKQKRKDMLVNENPVIEACKVSEI